MIVATAGHIDHGKTALIKALTGIDADRLPEEKKRGITVDLGFAYQRAGSGRSIGFVDVPGHEKLVRTMLAGASGVDFVMLVIAADDGIMPQTREHLAILDLLGLRRGVVVITKSDRVDAGRLASVAVEAEALVAGSGLGGAPILTVSAHTGAGIDHLASLLDTAAADTSGGRGSGGRFRLAVDRAFTLTGTGLVVTGTAHAGRVAAGDRLVLSPPGREIRVRGIRAQNESAEHGVAGDRCALNITGSRVEKADVARGAWILDPIAARPTSRADVHLRLLPSEVRPLRHWTPVHVHVGAADISGRVALLEGAGISPGETALGQIVLDEPTVALYGDRFVLRDQSARRTIGGGWIIDSRPPARNARKPERLAYLRALDHADAGEALDSLMAVSPNGLDLDHFAFLRNLDPGSLTAIVAPRDLIHVQVTGSKLSISKRRWTDLRAAMLAALDSYQITNPDSFGATLPDLAKTRPPPERPILAAILDSLVIDRQIARVGQILHLPGFSVTLSETESARWEEIAELLRRADLDPPRIAILAEQLRMTEEEIKPTLEKLGRMGRLTRISRAYFVLPSVIASLARHAETCASAHAEGILTVGQFREATKIGRHATMPILEFYDRIGFTRRHQDGRRLRCEADEIFASANGSDEAAHSLSQS